MSQGQFYLLDFRITGTGSVNIPGTIKQANAILSSQSTCKCIHKFKVTGEPRVVSVLKAENDVSLEFITSKLGSIGIVDVTCIPLTTYEVYASTVLGVDKSLTEPSNHKLDKAYTFISEITVDYHGMKWDAFRDLWAKEATTVLSLRKKGVLSGDLFKHKNSRKLLVIVSVDEPDNVDAMFSGLPLFVENGHNTSIVCRAIRQLDDYVGKMEKGVSSKGVSPTKKGTGAKA